MQFVKTEELRPGMRLAKPIYNKTGVTVLYPKGYGPLRLFFIA